MPVVQTCRIYLKSTFYAFAGD